MWGLLQIPGSGWSRVGCALGDLEKVMTPSVGHFLGLKGRSVTKSSWGVVQGQGRPSGVS